MPPLATTASTSGILKVLGVKDRDGSDVTQEEVEAENAVRRVKGVRAIAQEIQVRYAEAKKIEDDQIAARALAIIDWSVHLPKQAIQVKVAKGWIQTGKTGEGFVMDIQGPGRVRTQSVPRLPYPDQLVVGSPLTDADRRDWSRPANLLFVELVR